MSDKWKKLIEEYAKADIEAPSLKVATLAQWALESGFGTSDLAQRHNNFAGLKYRQRMSSVAEPVDYTAHDGEDTYCKFSSVKKFIAGYWHFISSGPYGDWTLYSDDPIGYIRYLHQQGYATDERYVVKVRDLMDEAEQALRDAAEELDLAPPELTETAQISKAAVVVGHNEKQRGAYSQHLQVSEWIFNQRVAGFMKKHAANLNLKVKIFLRTPGGGYSKEIQRVYRKVNAWNPKMAIELHFNAGGGRGTEMLHWHKSTNGKKLANAVQQETLEVLDLRNRGLKSIQQGDRGWRSLVEAAAPAILAEPFFGDSRRDSERMMEIGEERLARAYLRGLRAAADEL